MRKTLARGDEGFCIGRFIERQDPRHGGDCLCRGPYERLSGGPIPQPVNSLPIRLADQRKNALLCLIGLRKHRGRSLAQDLVLGEI